MIDLRVMVEVSGPKSRNWRSFAASPTPQFARLATARLFKSHFPPDIRVNVRPKFPLSIGPSRRTDTDRGNSTPVHLHAITATGERVDCSANHHDCGHSKAQLAPAGRGCRLVFCRPSAENRRAEGATSAPHQLT